MTSRNMPLPITDAERLHVLAYLAALAVSPVEGQDEDAAGEWAVEDRPAIYLRLTPVSQDWASRSGSLDIRRALKRTGAARTLGARGFLRTVRDLSTGSRAANQARRRAADEAGRRAQQEHRAEYLGCLGTGTMPARFRTGRTLSDRTPDNESAVSHRQNGSTELVRLRRDLMDEGASAWEDESDRVSDLEIHFLRDLLALAESLGFLRSEPIPAGWVHRVEPVADDEDYDGDQDEEPAAPVAVGPTPPPVPRVRELRPSFVAPPVETLTDPDDLLARTRIRPRVEEPTETVEEMRARWAREAEERVEAEARRRTAQAASPVPRRWACDACGNYDRHRWSPTSPAHCPTCDTRGGRFVAL